MDLRSTYDRIADDWAKDHAVDTWWIEGTDKFCSQLWPGAAVLDVGCGAGFKTNYLAEKGFDVTGFDFSEKMIAAAKRKYPKLRFEVADIYDVDRFNGKFDAVFAQAVLLHVPKSRIPEVIEKMMSRLNAGGLLYIAVKEKREGDAEEEVKRENDYGYDYERFFSYFEKKELRDHFKKAGMELIWESLKDSNSSSRPRNWLQAIGKKI